METTSIKHITNQIESYIKNVSPKMFAKYGFRAWNIRYSREGHDADGKKLHLKEFQLEDAHQAQLVREYFIRKGMISLVTNQEEGSESIVIHLRPDLISMKRRERYRRALDEANRISHAFNNTNQEFIRNKLLERGFKKGVAARAAREISGEHDVLNTLLRTFFSLALIFIGIRLLTTPDPVSDDTLEVHKFFGISLIVLTVLYWVFRLRVWSINKYRESI